MIPGIFNDEGGAKAEYDCLGGENNLQDWELAGALIHMELGYPEFDELDNTFSMME